MPIKMGQAHLKKKMAQDHLKKKMAQIVVTAQFKMGSPCLVPSLSLQRAYVLLPNTNSHMG
jgi:hypothetical protein